MRQGSSWLLGCGGRFHLLALAQGGKMRFRRPELSSKIKGLGLAANVMSNFWTITN
jgi:hypothetical protein